MSRRLLVASEYQARDRAHFAQAYEFCRVIAECDDADVIAPGINNYLHRYAGRLLPQHDSHNVQRDFNRLVNGARKMLRLKNLPSIEPVEVTGTYDVFLFVAWSPQSLVELARFRNWRRRCGVAILYLFELWSSTLKSDRPYLRLLQKFDYVFMLHAATVPALARTTRAHCSFLPVATDCLAAAPYPTQPARHVDIYSFGNRSEAVHQRLLELTRRRGWLYLYDSLASTDSRVKNWGEHRLLLANIIKRSRYFIAFSPAALAYAKAAKVAGEEVVAGRFFEGAAGGAIVLGAAPRCPEFDACFPWPNAVTEVSPDGSDVAEVIDRLDASPRLAEAIRRDNMIGCLRRHDWAHRWEHILSALGIDASPRLHQRIAALERAATALSAEPAAATLADYSD